MGNQDVGLDGGDLGAKAAALHEELALERSNNDRLMAQVMKAEDALAGSDAADFADVIPNEDREWWRGLLIENREAAVGMLRRLRNRAGRGAVAAAAVAQSRPLHKGTADFDEKPAVPF